MLPDSPPPPPPERLLAEADWLRGLARRLVRDAHGAEDVVQDTLVAALEAPALPAGRGLRGWLAVVARNVARGRGRAAAARTHHERAAAERRTAAGGEAGGGGAADEIDRLHWQRRLTDALLALEEPYRSAVLLRHRAGRSYAAIARRQGVSAAAARQRVSRGLAILRARLDRESEGGRAAWCLALGAFALERPGLAASTVPLVPLGGLAMGAKSLAVAVAATAALVAGIVAVRESRAPVPAQRAAVAPAPRAEGPVPDERAARLPERVPERAAPEPPATAPAAPATQPEPAEGPTDVLTGRVVDGDGHPIAGAEVTVRRDPLREYDTLDLSSRERVLGRTTSDADGSFCAHLAAGRPHDLVVAADDYAARRVVDAYAGEHCVVELGPAATLVATVVRADGAPVAGARVEGFGPRGYPALFEGRTGADGIFRAGGLHAGPVVVTVDPPGLAAPPRAGAELAAGETAALRFVARPGTAAAGRVLDAETERPVEGARVGISWVQQGAVRTDADGAYRLAGIGEGHHELVATAEGYGRAVERIPGAHEGTSRLDFRLVPEERARGRVLDAGGRPLAGAYVAAVRSWVVDGLGSADWLPARTGSEGRFEVRGLAPDAPYCLFVRAPGHGTSVFELPRVPAVAGVREVGDVALPPGGLLRGRVVDAAGRPLPDLALSLECDYAERTRLSGPVDEPADRSYVSERRGRTDHLGRFAFADLASGTYVVRAGPRGPSWAATEPIELARGEERADLRLVYDEGRTLRGRVVAPDGRPVAQVVVNVTSEATPGPPRMALSGTDGSFAVRRLEPGPVAVQAVPTSFSGGEDQPLFEATVAGVDPDAGELSVVLPAGVRTTGTVVDAAGEPVARARVAARDPLGEHVASDFTDLEGRFELLLPPEALVDLRATPPPEGTAFYRPHEGEPPAEASLPGIVAGASDLRLALVPRAPEASLSDPR